MHSAANLKAGAGDEIRTRDIQLGRLELYQLSYSRLHYRLFQKKPGSSVVLKNHLII